MKLSLNGNLCAASSRLSPLYCATTTTNTTTPYQPHRGEILNTYRQTSR